jgi:CBS domain containing-hemolysin-like protein
MLSAILPQLVGLAVLLTFSAFFSASETALFSLNRAQVQRLREAGGRIDRAIADLLATPRRLLVTLLVGNMLVNTALASIVATICTGLLGDSGVGVAIGAATLLLLIFGEVTPKSFAVRHARDLARFVALPLVFFSKLVYPVRVVLPSITNAILFVLRQSRIPSETLITGRELRAAFDVGQEEGVIDAHERELVEHIFEFRHLAARELMVPRTDMVCVTEDATVAEAHALARRSRHTRLPVYSTSPDEIRTIFDVKDLPAWREHGIWPKTLRDFVAWRDALSDPPSRPVVRPAFLVPDSRHADDLLRDMRQTGAHLAILVDEYGGTSGLVTLHQLVDVLVGGVLAREEGTGAPLYRRTHSGFQLLGEARLRDVNRELGMDLPLGKADTVGGYVLGLFGDLPKPGDEVAEEHFVFKVRRMTGRRIAAVEARPIPTPEERTEPDSADAREANA